MRAVALALILAALTPATAHALDAGVGRSDVTPPTGFPTMGYVRDDAIARGQHTRLFARAIVLRQGETKLAIVTIDLGFTPGGLLVEVAQRLAARGFSERNIIISASHTHSGPAGYSNFGSDNFVAPTMGDPANFKLAGDPRLYGFLIERIALAIVRADDDLAAARVGWGSAQLLGITDNRSLEAHLADHGLDLPYGKGRVADDPGGYPHTIDPEVDVLRVDRVVKRRRVPLGAWLDFADHGTINPYQFGVYNADHHGPASRLFERAVRRLGHVPATRDVVGAYGNADAGDMTAGLRGRGPAYAQHVGQLEADAFVRAWREAGARMSSRPALDVRWTRSCFCGRAVDGGQVADRPAMGFPFFTGSEENRGPLFDETQVNHEGMRLPADVGPQGRKIETVQPPVDDFPPAIPLMVARVGDRLIATIPGGATASPPATPRMVARVGDRLIATIPGEATAEMGRRVRAAVAAAAAPLGIKDVALAGYANEYLHYFTTPEEYDMQHYEGGSTVFGRYSSNLVMGDLATLASSLARGAPAPPAYAFDPRNGVVPDLRPYEPGADHGDITAQPRAVQRMQRAQVAWRGGERGLDRPLDQAFVRVERRSGRRWRTATDDLGLEIVWRVDDGGGYTAQWQVPLSAQRGAYRFVVPATRSRLESAPFAGGPATTLAVHALGRSGGS